MKKILFVNDLAYAGGTEKVLQNITAALPDEYDITVLTMRRQKEFYNYYSSKIRYLYMYTDDMLESCNFLMKCINRVRRDYRQWVIGNIIKSYGFDTVVSIKEGECMKYVAKLKADRKVGWIHTDFDVLHWSAGCFGDGEELECMKKFDKIVCVSENVMRNVIKNVGDSGNIIVLENPIDEKYIVRKAAKSQNMIRKDSKKLLFVTVGRLCREKGYDMLLSACRLLNDNGYKEAYDVWIIGGGECEEELRRQCSELETDNVHLIGHQDNPYAFIKEADWFISTSRAEGYAIAPQEAAILGIPIIATDCSGVRELLGDSRYGIIIDSSIEAIADSMEQVIIKPDMHDCYKKQIEERAQSISLSARMKKIEAIF